MNRAFRTLVVAGGLWLAQLDFAHAHLVNTGFGPFYNGLCHPFVNPTDLMIVLALSLLGGFGGPASGRNSLFPLIFAWMAGTVIGHTWLDESWALPVVVSAATILVVAILVAVNLRCPNVLLGFAGVAIGLCFGVSNGAEFASLNKGPLALVGIVTAVFVVATWITSLAVKNDHGWRRIVVRVAGSWIAAASLLIIGWELRGVLSS
jgi:hydrogenase/urease accessory protein HupE